MNLLKLNRDGDLQWTQVFGGQNSEMGYSVLQSSDKGYVIAGQTKSLGGGGDAYIVKTEGSETGTSGQEIVNTITSIYFHFDKFRCNLHQPCC
ncbi:MAG: hypothetical protein IBX40_00300 [Methanosarcinales archaeon]|nr:hypothetical protein [Methanosarcinales archaeon]